MYIFVPLSIVSMLPPRQKVRRDIVDHAGDALQRAAVATTRRRSTVEAAFNIIRSFSRVDVTRVARFCSIYYVVRRLRSTTYLPAEGKSSVFGKGSDEK